ncbi:MAG TPA: hypothetical protein VGU63_11785 [Candidatus Acidoferrales bacterium]|nr:hypothetical protein [Candidatus Acidoferrales bacterium]
MATKAAHPGRTHRDDYFFWAMALLACVIVFIGFAHTYFFAGLFRAKLPSLLVHLHGAMFSCWLLLLIAQITLVSVGRVEWHQKLGIFGIILAALMVLVGMATLVAALRRHASFGMGTDALFAADVLQLSAFAVLAFWAFSVRKDGAAHKRLILLATVALLGPALSRWPFAFVFSSAFVFFGILDSFLIFMMAFDLWSRRRLHPATIGGSLIIAVMQFSMGPLAHSAFWHQFTAWVQGP